MALSKPSPGASINWLYTFSRKLIGCWPFNEGAGSKVSNLGGILWNVNLSNTSWRSGQKGFVLNFNGTDSFVDFPLNSMAAGQSEITLATRIKLTSFNSNDAIYNEVAGNEFWQFSILEGSFLTRDTSTGITGSRDNDLSMPSLPVEEWIDLVFVYSVSLSLKAIYKNGFLVASTSTGIDTLTSERSQIRLGWPTTDAPTNYFNGGNEYLYLWHRPLSEDEIFQLHKDPYAMFNRSTSPAVFFMPGAIVKTVDETLGWSEGIIRKGGSIHLIGETLGWSEGIIRKGGSIHLIGETLGWSDDFINVTGTIKIINDLLGWSDEFLKVTGTIKILNETLGWSESIIRKGGSIHLIGETLGWSEGTIKKLSSLTAIVSLINETVGWNEEVFKETGFAKVINETLTWGEGVFKFFPTMSMFKPQIKNISIGRLLKWIQS